MTRLNEQIGLLQNWIDESDSIVFFGGAGVSTESGIPDFRSADGLFFQKNLYPPETILSHRFFMEHPDVFYRFYKDKVVFQDAKPNIAHSKLAEWERRGKLKAVVTQNIDGLHQMAGSNTVYELHGSIHKNRCMKCDASYGLDMIMERDYVLRCSCGGVIKPEVVLYEEALDEKVLIASIDAIQKADLLLVGGSSLVVYPAAGLLRYFRGRRLVVINHDILHHVEADLFIQASLGDVFSKLQ